MLKRLSLLLALILMFCMPAGAENTVVVDEVITAVQPLMDLTALAACAGAVPLSVEEGETLSAQFVHNLLLCGQTQGQELGVTAALLTDTQAQRALLSGLYTGALPELNPIDSIAEPYSYVGVQMMSAEASPDGSAIQVVGTVYVAPDRIDRLSEDAFTAVTWLDLRAGILLRRADDAPLGWKLASFTTDTGVAVESLTDDYFGAATREYLNTDLGFSLLYPAAFGEETLREDESGISAALADGSASFFARRLANKNGDTLDTILLSRQQADADAQINVNGLTGCGRVTTVSADGVTTVDFYLVTDAWLYQAELVYAERLAREFSLYSDYMMNSFTADELGIG